MFLLYTHLNLLHLNVCLCLSICLSVCLSPLLTSKDIFLQVFTAANRILAPVAVPPVKEIMGILGWAARQAPTESPRPNTMLNTPGGTPAQPTAHYMALGYDTKMTPVSPMTIKLHTTALRATPCIIIIIVKWMALV